MTAQAIINVYNQVGSVRKTSALLCVSYQTVRKTLVTAGIFPSERSLAIVEQFAQGMPKDEIAASAGIKVRSVLVYLPYSKGPYYLDPESKTPNARTIAASRERRKIGVDKMKGAR